VVAVSLKKKAASDPAVLPGEECAALADALMRAAKLCETSAARAAVRAIECGARGEAGDASVVEWLARVGGCSTGRVRASLATVQQVAEFPATQAALVAGEVSLEQAAEVVSVPGHEAELLGVAKTSGLRAVKDLARKRRCEGIAPEELYARQRAARERQQRLERALQHVQEIEAQKKSKDKEARASTTDADAHVMKMGDGGFRPAYNLQLATDTEAQIITGVDVSTSGGDQGKMAPMVHQHEERYGEAPKEVLVDGGFAKKEDIEEVSPPHGTTTVYTPVQKSKDPERDPHTPRADDAPAVAEWRQRMASEAAKEIYKQRASTAECVNALARNRGLYQFRVRGQVKVRAALLWFVLAHNLVRAATLRAERSLEGG